MNKLWQVIVAPDVVKKIKRLQPKEQERINARIKKFRKGLTGADVKKLSERGEWRLRIGRWRLIFRVNLEKRFIAFIKFGPRGDVYKK